MRTISQINRRLLGSVLVTLQFGLILGLTVLAWPAVRQFDISVSTWLLGVAAGVLAAWTLAHNRLGNFNIHPEPKTGGVLISSGPYRWIRHPMYSAVLLGAAALALVSNPLPAWLAWGSLALVLRVKAALEERWMRAQHPGYAAYSRANKRFVPWLL